MKIERTVLKIELQYICNITAPGICVHQGDSSFIVDKCLIGIEKAASTFQYFFLFVHLAWFERLV